MEIFIGNFIVDILVFGFITGIMAYAFLKRYEEGSNMKKAAADKANKEFDPKSNFRWHLVVRLFCAFITIFISGFSEETPFIYAINDYSFWAFVLIMVFSLIEYLKLSDERVTYVKEFMEKGDRPGIFPSGEWAWLLYPIYVGLFFLANVNA